MLKSMLKGFVSSILFAFLNLGVFFSSFLFLIFISEYYYPLIHSGLLYKAFFVEGFSERLPNYWRFFVIQEILFALVISIYCIFQAYLFVKRSSKFPSIFINIQLLVIASAFVGMIGELVMDAKRNDYGATVHFLKCVVLCSLWITYIRTSKRISSIFNSSKDMISGSKSNELAQPINN